IQVDFQLPDKFGLEYTDADGNRQRPVMIHRALFGSVERFIGVLTEHFAGAFPTWLAPQQVVLIPIADRHLEYAHSVAARLRAEGLRADVDASDNTMGAKIRTNQLHKVPYMLIVGDNEQSGGSVSVRPRVGDEHRNISVDDFLEKIAEEIKQRSVDLVF
nr:threonine--tRNA ligase [Actinomycetota bacterium]